MGDLARLGRSVLGCGGRSSRAFAEPSSIILKPLWLHPPPPEPFRTCS
jgi:hypothetical protein